MAKRFVPISLLLLLLLLTGCATEATPSPEPPPTDPPPPTESPTVLLQGALISEVLPGVPGTNNNLEFIELHNAGTEALDLKGWSLWYRLDDKQEEQQVYAWDSPRDIPGHGHFLIVRSGQDVGNLGDAEFDLPLFEKRGGLALREAGLRHIYEFVEPDRPYSDIYQGESETLDHSLVTPSLYDRLHQVEALHINADYPLPASGDTSARGSSDHDPITAKFSFD